MSNEVVEKIQSLLFEVSTLTDMAEKGSIDFVPAVKHWFRNVEHVFVEGRIASGAQIAVFRGNLASVERDNLIPEGITFLKPPSRIKLQRAVAMVFMSKTVEVIYGYLTHVSVALGNSNEHTP